MWIGDGVGYTDFGVFRFVGIVSAKMTSSAASAAIRSILIQKEGALDPLDEGFRLGSAAGTISASDFQSRKRTAGTDGGS